MRKNASVRSLINNVVNWDKCPKYSIERLANNAHFSLLQSHLAYGISALAFIVILQRMPWIDYYRGKRKSLGICLALKLQDFNKTCTS